MIRILVVTKSHVLPKVLGASVAQVLAIETDLVVTFSHCGLISGHDAIISQERWNHIDGVGPREGMYVNRGTSGIICYFTRAGVGLHDGRWHRHWSLEWYKDS